MTRRVQVCIAVGVLYNFVSGVTVFEKPDTAGSNPAVGNDFYLFSDTR